MALTSLLDSLKVGSCFGTFVKLPRPEIVDILALAGFDFAICDMEHAQMSESEARLVIRACVGNDIPVVVRLPEPTQGAVNRLLEAGAVGIQMPRLRTQAETQELFAMSHFPPLGRRSVGNANRRGEYGAIPIAEYVRQNDGSAIVIGQFETRESERPFDPVMEQMDVAFIGPTDLSVDYGEPGNSESPTVVAHIAEVEAAAARTGTFMGVFVSDVLGAERRVLEGYRYIAVGSDVSFIASEFHRVGDKLLELRMSKGGRDS